MRNKEVVHYAKTIYRGEVPLADSYDELYKDLLTKVTPEEALKLKKPEIKFVNIKNHQQKFQDTIAMPSYPRSGNTLLRAYLEKIMGLATGSDQDITRALIKDLHEQGFVGEGLAGKRVQVVKTHYPERHGPSQFYANRGLLVIRNPMDAMWSFFNMQATTSHVYSIAEEDFPLLEKKWDQFVRTEISVWNDFHGFWVNSFIPLHIIRYEDLVYNSEPTLKKALEFILNVDDISGTKVHQYLKLAVSEESPKIYKPREGVPNKSLKRFTKEQLEFI